MIRREYEDGETCDGSVAEWTDANECDDEFCELVRSLGVGESFDFGGGAQPFATFTRIR
jgi:hypothetical protein